MTEQYVPLSAREALTFTINKTARGTAPVVCHLRRPTPTEKQNLGLAMFEAGIRQPQQSQIRAAQISGLFKVMSEDDAEQGAAKLNAYFMMLDRHAQELIDWFAAERERKIDEENGAPPKEAAPRPEPPIDDRTRREVELLLYEVSADALVRRLLMERQRFDAESAFWLTRSHLLPATQASLPDGLVLTWGKDNILDTRSLDDLIDYLGNEAFDALSSFIDQQYRLGEELEKNSELRQGTWPPEEEPLPEPENIGSGTPSGISTGSATEPTPASASAQIIAPSLSMSGEPGVSTANITPMDRAASTNPF